ncbi:hypothetical protein HAX54_035319 [Datura stramonium]|uniref:Uncharacterized protein n=1 Tax=Datura stramonium TaxID=4076 RepID=A0ABS8VGC0_DATST|nr:hypothetical protein [Datura stramonium]
MTTEMEAIKGIERVSTEDKLMHSQWMANIIDKDKEGAEWVIGRKLIYKASLFWPSHGGLLSDICSCYSESSANKAALVEYVYAVLLNILELLLQRLEAAVRSRSITRPSYPRERIRKLGNASSTGRQNGPWHREQVVTAPYL